MPMAKTDLVLIKAYISKDSVYYANKTIYDIKERINTLLLFPYMGRYVPKYDINSIRELIYKSYRIIYYVSSSNDIYILKILHHSQNILYFKSELFH